MRSHPASARLKRQATCQPKGPESLTPRNQNTLIRPLNFLARRKEFLKHSQTIQNSSSNITLLKSDCDMLMEGLAGSRRCKYSRAPAKRVQLLFGTYPWWVDSFSQFDVALARAIKIHAEQLQGANFLGSSLLAPCNSAISAVAPRCETTKMTKADLTQS